MGLAKGRTAYFLLSSLGGGAAAAWGQPLIHNNSDAASVIVTVFSVLAGFLVGLIALTGDASPVAARGSWRFTELNREGVSRRLTHNRGLFVLYLLVLALIFLASLLKTVAAADALIGAFLNWVERIYLGLAVLAFLLSFRLPWTLTRIQQERYDAVLEQQRRNSGILS